MATAPVRQEPLERERGIPSDLSGLRMAPRYSFDGTCQIEFEGLGRVQAPAVNLSAAGLRIELDVLPDEGTQVRCAIALPNGAHWIVGGNVARVIDRAKSGIAIAFEGVTSFDRAQLAAAFG